MVSTLSGEGPALDLQGSRTQHPQKPLRRGLGRQHRELSAAHLRGSQTPGGQNQGHWPTRPPLEPAQACMRALPLPGHHFLTVRVSVCSARRSRPAPGAGTALRPCHGGRRHHVLRLATAWLPWGPRCPSSPCVLLRPRRPGTVQATPRRAGRGPRGGGARGGEAQQMGSRVNAAPRGRGVRQASGQAATCAASGSGRAGQAQPCSPAAPTAAPRAQPSAARRQTPVRGVTSLGPCSAAAAPPALLPRGV